MTDAVSSTQDWNQGILVADSKVSFNEVKNTTLAVHDSTLPGETIFHIDGGFFCKVSHDGTTEYDWERIETAAAQWHLHKNEYAFIVAKLLLPFKPNQAKLKAYFYCAEVYNKNSVLRTKVSGIFETEKTAFSDNLLNDLSEEVKSILSNDDDCNILISNLSLLSGQN